MYQRLVTVVGVFGGLFFLATVVFMLNSGSPFLPWQWAWVEQGTWELLNLSVLATHTGGR
ncbi:hypothetical protein B484DRAFT_411921 [Ochromonadaceae sp. CCMP2298]|nr:hypothetical protein B484DRAFT_411921 [Ochromonadaceae sp. CCMP2298]